MKRFDLAALEPELRGDLPRRQRWEPLQGWKLRDELTLLRDGIATPARILQCEWYDDGGQGEDYGPTVRAQYVYFDQEQRAHVKGYQQHFDGWHASWNPFFEPTLQTWHLGGWITVLYPETKPDNSHFYMGLPVKVCEPPPAKAPCPCCTFQTLEAATDRCPVCGWTANSTPLAEAQQNYRLFGAWAESARRAVRTPYRYELGPHMFEPPHMWLVPLGVLPAAYWEQVWQVLKPMLPQFREGWQILVAEHPNLTPNNPVEWWELYEPHGYDAALWQRVVSSTIRWSGANIPALCDALTGASVVQSYRLNPARLQRPPKVKWLHWSVIALGKVLIEFRIGQRTE